MNNLPHTQNLLQGAVERSFRDPAYFLRFFLSHWFPSHIPPFHLGIIALRTRKVAFLDDYPEAHNFLLKYFKYESDPAFPDAKPVPVFVRDSQSRLAMIQPKDNLNEIIPRGFSKTTLMKGLDLYELLTVSSTFAVYISASAPHAEAQLLDIKAELEGNDLIREAYGDQVPTRSEPEKWSGKELQLRNGAILVAKGRGGQVRGLTRQGKRPNLIIMDDIEDEDSIATEIQRQKTTNWFYGSVVPAGQIMEGAVGEDWAQEPLRIINLGTLLGPECLVTNLNRNDDFSTIRFGARVAPGVMLWPYKMSERLYEHKRAQYQRSGSLSHFVKEYDSEIRVSEEAIFPEIFHYVPVARSDLAQVATMLDPAISEEATADEAAIVVAGRHRDSGALWFLDEWGGIGKSPQELVKHFFDYHLIWKSELNGIEAIAYQASLLHLVREEMARRKHFFHITPVRHGSKQSKAARIIGTLSPRYANNFIRHHRPLHKLESNLLDWPNGRKDFADAASMALNLLGETVGLVMENALEDLPAFQQDRLPAALPQVGNYFVGSGAGRYVPAGKNPRYGG